MNVAMGEAAPKRLKNQNVDAISPPRPPRAQVDPAVAEIARYVADMTAELSEIAGKAKLDTLAYFLAMARLEAELKSRRT